MCCSRACPASARRCSSGRSPTSSTAPSTGSRRPNPLPARPAVLRPGNPEPPRDGGDLSPARGPARPLPVQGHGPVPERGGPHHDHGPDDRQRVGHGREGLYGRRASRGATTRARGGARALPPPPPRHRSILNFEGEAEGITPEAIVRSILDAVPAPSVE